MCMLTGNARLGYRAIRRSATIEPVPRTRTPAVVFSLALLLLASAAGIFAFRCSGSDASTTSTSDTGAGPKRSGHTIADENAKPGSSDWAITRPSLVGEIQGYAGQVSVQRGDKLDVYVSTAKDGTKYEADVYRMGWYGGAGARKVHSIKNIDGQYQGRWDPLRGLRDCPTCKIDPSTLLLEANWKRSLQVKIDDDWVSGYYVIKLHELATDTSSYVIFLVRDDASDAPALVQASTNTWQAYNVWGDASLYGSFGANRKYVAKTRRAYQVSYDRPYDVAINGSKNYGAGEFFSWEYDFVRWAESTGYEMSYTTNVDVHLRPDTLLRHRMFISLGHDEYWTKSQRDAAEQARDSNVNMAFFVGNEAYWQARIDASSSGTKARVITEYKDAALDPLARSQPKEATVMFKDAPVSRPQSLLSGAAYGSNATPDYQPWRASSTDNWVFDGTAIVAGQPFPGIVGYEYDHMAVASERPPGLTVLGSSPVNGFLGSDTSISSVYVADSGATVFCAGTVAWSWGLDDYGHADRGAYADPQLRKLTQNVMDRLTAAPQREENASR